MGRTVTEDREWRLNYNRTRHNERAEMIREYKAEQGCKHCGTKDFRVLTFHHRIQEEKEFHVAKGLKYSLKRLWAEIDKCDVLCHNCHAIETWEKHYG